MRDLILIWTEIAVLEMSMGLCTKDLGEMCLRRTSFKSNNAYACARVCYYTDSEEERFVVAVLF